MEWSKVYAYLIMGGIRLFFFTLFLFFVCALSGQEKLVQEGQFEAALNLTNQLLEKDSSSFALHHLKFQIFRNNRQDELAFQQARKNFQTFFHIATDEQKVILWLNWVEAAILVEKKDKRKSYLGAARQLLNREKKKRAHLLPYYWYLEGRALGRGNDLGKSFFLKALGHPVSDPYLLGRICRELGIYHRVIGDFTSSLNYYKKELQVYQNHYAADHFDIGSAQYGIGCIYYELIEYEKGLEHFLASYAIWKNYLEPTDTYMRYLTDAIGNLYWELGNNGKALEFFDFASKATENIEVHPKISVILSADSLLEEERFNEALEIYKDALAFRNSVHGKHHAITGACQSQIANTYLKKGALSQALDAYQKAFQSLVIGFESMDPQMNPDLSMQVSSKKYLVDAMVGKARTLKAIYQQTKNNSDLKLAFQTTLKALEMLENLRYTPLAEQSRFFWTQKYFPLFETALYLANQFNYQEQEYIQFVYPIMEKSKTLSLQSNLRLGEAYFSAHQPSDLIDQEYDIKKRIHDYQFRIDNIEKACWGLDSPKLKLWKEQLVNLNVEYESLLEQIRIEEPKYFNLKYGLDPVSIDKLTQNILRDNQSALIEFFEGEEHIYAICITAQNTFAHQIEKDKAFLQHLNTFLAEFYTPGKRLKDGKSNLQGFAQNAFFLYQQLLEPLLNKCAKSINKLFIIPDNKLFLIPFESLLLESAEETQDFQKLKFLVKDYFVTYAQSSSTLYYAHQQKSSKTFEYAYLGFAPTIFAVTDAGLSLNELTWNVGEVQSSAEIWQGRHFEQSSATKSKFIHNVDKSCILHIASHAILDNQNPMHSAIFFQDTASEHENILRTFDLYSLPIEAELVVLNACNTGVGKWERGEGMMSFERAFQYAGSPALVSSLWSIDDEATSQLTIHFFTYLQQGHPKDEALALAKRSYLGAADPLTRHPFFWAGLRLTGNTLPISRPTFFAKLPWMAILISTCLLILLFIWGRNKLI